MVVKVRVRARVGVRDGVPAPSSLSTSISEQWAADNDNDRGVA